MRLSVSAALLYMLKSQRSRLPFEGKQPKKETFLPLSLRRLPVESVAQIEGVSSCLNTWITGVPSISGIPETPQKTTESSHHTKERCLYCYLPIFKERQWFPFCFPYFYSFYNHFCCDKVWWMFWSPSGTATVFLSRPLQPEIYFLCIIIIKIFEITVLEMSSLWLTKRSLILYSLNVFFGRYKSPLL